MANYTASFHAPEFTDDEFERQRAEYIAKNGYVITLPTFRDIIKLPIHKPITPDEKLLYYSGRKGEIPEARRRELKIMKADKRFHMESMLGSPTPRLARSIGSILQCIDDAQDFLISAAAIGRIALKFLPKIALRFLGWPVTALWLISTAMNFFTAPTYCMVNPMGCKRKMKEMLYGADKGRKAKAKKALTARKNRLEGLLKNMEEQLKKASGAKRKELLEAINELKKRLNYVNGELATGLNARARQELRNARRYVKSGTVIPSFAEGIQMLQVTSDIWGAGVSCGAAMGLLVDLYSGGVRWLRGEKVSFRNTPTAVEIYQKAEDERHLYARTHRPTGFRSQAEFEIWKMKKQAAGEWGYRNRTTDMCAYAAARHANAHGILRRTNWNEEVCYYAAAEVAASHLNEIIEYWDAFENVDGMEHIEIEARVPDNPLIWECFEEAGLNYQDYVGWPSVGKRWATYDEISSTVAPIAAENLEYMQRECHDQAKVWIANSCAQEAGLRYIAGIIGEDGIEIENHAIIQIIEMLLNHGLIPPRGMTEEQALGFAQYCERHQEAGTRPTLKEVIASMKNNLNLEFVTYATESGV